MNNILTILQKEFKIFVRDRRSLVTILVVPLVFYPLIFNVLGYFSRKNRQELKTATLKVLLDASIPDALARHIPEEDHLEILRQLDGDPIQALEKDRIHAIAALTEGTLEIRYLSSERKSREAAARLKQAATDWRSALIAEKITAAGLPETVLKPFEITRKDLASQAKRTGMFLGRILPYMIIIMLFSGAMGFGLEVSTGEKEKGTIATLLVSQASRTQIVLGKLLYVVAIEILYGVLNIAGFVLAAGMQASRIDPKIAAEAARQSADSFAFAVAPQTFFLLLFLILPIALIAASLIIAIGSYARSMKEGQTIFTPLLMVFILIGIISMAAPLKVPEYYFWIPVLNTSFAMQELLTLKFHFGHFLSAMFTTTALAVVIIAGTIWMFNRETIHFRS